MKVNARKGKLFLSGTGIIMAITVILSGTLLSSCKNDDAIPTDISVTGADYFPIGIGKIKYNYNELGGGSRQWILMSGSVEWDVKSLSRSNDSTIYKITETRIFTINSQNTDTVITDFVITEDKLHSISINKDLGISHISGITFNRYDSKNLPDTLSFNWNNGYFKLKKNKGLIEMYDCCCGKDYWKLEMTE